MFHVLDLNLLELMADQAECMGEPCYWDGATYGLAAWVHCFGLHTDNTQSCVWE